MSITMKIAPAAVAAALLVAPAAAQTVDVSRLGYDRGNPGASVHIIEFADFACSACGQFARDVWPQLQREFVANGAVQWKYVPMVLGMFPNGDDAATAAECAADQSSFWSMHDLLYADQKDWSRERNPRPKFEEFARRLKLDPDAFAQCYDQNSAGSRTALNDEAARKLAIRGTPTFFVNGQRVVGALPIEEWRKVLALVMGGGS